MSHNQPENMASYGAYNSYPEATTNGFSRTIPSFVNSQQFTPDTKYQDNTQGVPGSYSQSQSQHMSRNLSNGSYTSQSSAATTNVPSPETPMTFADMSEWDSSYPPYDQSQYSAEYAGTDQQQWFPEDNTYSTGFIEPSSTTYNMMSPIDNVNQMNYQYPQSMPVSMSIPRNDPMAHMQDSVLLPEAEVPNTSHICTVPGCESKTSFKRKADLMRHFEQIHQAPDQKKQFFCDYTKCDRSQDPFGRIDHFRQHYRDFHGEDLPRKSGESSNWYADKKQTVSKRWWRCVKCLNKVTVKDFGFTCNECNTPCETQRRQIRGYT